MTGTTHGTRTRPHVLVLGAGFGGVAAVRELKDAPADVTLVDRNGYNTFQPLLYQVATGGLNPGDVTYAARALTARQHNATFRKGDVATPNKSASASISMSPVGIASKSQFPCCRSCTGPCKASAVCASPTSAATVKRVTGRSIRSVSWRKGTSGIWSE